MTEPQGIQTVVLCGGKGTRLREYTEAMPKVLIEVGARRAAGRCACAGARPS